MTQRVQTAVYPWSHPLYLGHMFSFSSFGYSAAWADKRHRFRRLASEFFGTFGLVFSLSGGAAIFHALAVPPFTNGTVVVLLTMVSAMWLVIAIYALGDISAHFNPAITFAFALRGDISWRRTLPYCVVQCGAASVASLLVKWFFGASSGLAAVHPQPGKAWQAVATEALLTTCFIVLIFAMARGPKLNQPFTPLAVAAYVLSFGSVCGLYEGAAFNPARAFGPDVAIGRFDDLWIYVLGAGIGAVLAVGIDRYFRDSSDPGKLDADASKDSGSSPSPHSSPQKT